MNFLKHMPKINKKDTYGNSVIKYIVIDANGFNSGEFDTKSEAMVKHFSLPGSKVFKFMIYELLK